MKYAVTYAPMGRLYYLKDGWIAKSRWTTFPENAEMFETMRAAESAMAVEAKRNGIRVACLAVVEIK